jgi:hypothetical protein
MSVAVAAKEILPFIWKSITRTGFDTGFALTLAL